MAEANTTTKQLPLNWPEEIPYLTRPRLSPSITPIVLKLLNTPTLATSTHKRLLLTSIPFPDPRVRIAPILEPSHPANDQHGLFAVTHLLPDTFIVPYIGYVHSSAPSDSDPTSTYDISFDRELGLGIDAAKVGAEARFINDYRGIAEKPNAEFRDCWVQTEAKKWERWIGIFVMGPGKAGKRKAGIRPNEEILVSYGKGFWKGREFETERP